MPDPMDDHHMAVVDLPINAPGFVESTGCSGRAGDRIGLHLRLEWHPVSLPDGVGSARAQWFSAAGRADPASRDTARVYRPCAREGI